MAGMAEQEASWDEALYHLNLLSMNNFSGAFVFHMNNGRISRSTLKRINDLARDFRDQTQEAPCRT